MAADRVAEDRGGADEILAVEPAGSHQSAPAGGHRQTALAHRARLRGTEAGTGTGTLRRPQLARISSSRHALHCRLWISGAGAVPFSPCTRFAATAGSRPPASPTPYATQLHAPRRSRAQHLAQDQAQVEGADMNQLPLQNVRVSAQVRAPHGASVVAVRKAAFHQLAAPPQ